MDYPMDQYHLNTERFQDYDDPAPDLYAQRAPSERSIARKNGRGVSQAVAKGYGPANVRAVTSYENLFQTEQQGIPAHLQCMPCGKSPEPYWRPQRNQTIDERSQAMNERWAESCGAKPNQTRPAMTVDRKTEGFAGGLDVMNPDHFMMFLLFLLVVVFSYMIRSVWRLDRKVTELRERVRTLKNK